MDGILLLLPILVPILGGLAVLGIHNMKTRRLTVTLLLVFQIFVVLEVARNDTEPFVLLQLTDGACSRLTRWGGCLPTSSASSGLRWLSLPLST